MARFDPVDPRVRLAIAHWPPDAPRGAVRPFCLERTSRADLARTHHHVPPSSRGPPQAPPGSGPPLVCLGDPGSLNSALSARLDGRRGESTRVSTLLASSISSAYRKADTRWQRRAALTGGMSESAAAPGSGITVYGCGQDESALFRELAPCYGVAARITAAAASEGNVELASGNRCISVAYAQSVGISVGNVSYSPDAVADYTLMLMLMAVRNARSIVSRAEVHDY